MSLELQVPAPSHHDQFKAMVDAYRSAGEDRYQDVQLSQIGFSNYLRKLAECAGGTPPGPGLVPGSIFWLTEEGSLIGVVRIRHHLSEALLVEGGHIGYDISPEHRGRGYGSKILKLALEKAKELGIGRALLTCDYDNTPSIKIIEKNGGVFDNTSVSPRTGKIVNRYWIDLEGS